MTQNGTVAGNGTQTDSLKIVIVGDGGCGKTSLLMVYAKGDFPEKYAPSVFDKYVTTVSYGGKDIQLNLYDTAGQEDYDRLRPLSYQEVNLVVICYDVTNPTSFDNVTIKIQKQMNLEIYLECSAKYRENVEDIFREATKRALAARAKARHHHKKKKRCTIL
ncbi:hypothetical protein cypCar_00031540 [Cyprinus carpio]|nr:hypothetical protein cypCar_00031540 [Cyprinus carpio]